MFTAVVAVLRGRGGVSKDASAAAAVGLAFHSHYLSSSEECLQPQTFRCSDTWWSKAPCQTYAATRIS